MLSSGAPEFPIEIDCLLPDVPSALIFAHRAGPASATASTTRLSRRRTELIAFGLEFGRVDPAQITIEDTVAMHAAARFRIAVEGHVSEHMTIARETFCGWKGR